MMQLRVCENKLMGLSSLSSGESSPKREGESLLLQEECRPAKHRFEAEKSQNLTVIKTGYVYQVIYIMFEINAKKSMFEKFNF